jgi:hypothetical protein
MISGATYRDGVAIAANGAVYVFGVASTASVPPTAAGSGAKLAPRGMKVTSDGALYVRYV